MFCSHVWSILKQPIYNFCRVLMVKSPFWRASVWRNWCSMVWPLTMLRRSSARKLGRFTAQHRSATCVLVVGDPHHQNIPKYEHTKNIKEQHVWNRKPNLLYTRVGCFFLVEIFSPNGQPPSIFTVRSCQMPQFCLGNPIETPFIPHFCHVSNVLRRNRWPAQPTQPVPVP